MNKAGKIIVLNGASSSGKTTLARQIQSASTDIYLLCALDAFWNMTPANVPAGSHNFPNMKLALAKSVKALAETGHNVIVDIVFSGKKTYNELTTELQGFNLKMIKVECPLGELITREIARGDRSIGLAKSQFESVHTDVLYDLIINTVDNTPAQCAKNILESV